MLSDKFSTLIKSFNSLYTELQSLPHDHPLKKEIGLTRATITNLFWKQHESILFQTELKEKEFYCDYLLKPLSSTFFISIPFYLGNFMTTHVLALNFFMSLCGLGCIVLDKYVINADAYTNLEQLIQSLDKDLDLLETHFSKIRDLLLVDEGIWT